MNLVNDYESKQALVPAAKRRREKGAKTTQVLKQLKQAPPPKPSHDIRNTSISQPPSQLLGQASQPSKRERERSRKAS